MLQNGQSGAAHTGCCEEQTHRILQMFELLPYFFSTCTVKNTKWRLLSAILKTNKFFPGGGSSEAGSDESSPLELTTRSP
jgi:hypothetical protein